MFLNQGRLLLKIRAKHKLTQSKLANYMGMHVQQISNIERGRQGIPLEYIRALKDLISLEEIKKAYTRDLISEINQACPVKKPKTKRLIVSSW